MRIFHPEPKHVAERDALLLRAMREPGSPFPIADEYPIVLAPENAALSYIVEDEGRLAAHANLWPRRAGGRTVGLIGNVATAAESRGRGLQRALFERLIDDARAAGLAALFLWSDLQDFYKKLGFREWGKELRLTYRTSDLPRGDGWRVERKPDPAALLARRWRHAPVVERSAEDFATLLTIPAMAVFTHERGYTLTGKGCDMQGVVHEWGAPDPGTLLAGVRATAEVLELERIMLLTPGQMPRDWRSALAKPADHVEEHAMAWALCDEEALKDLFIWGLDSI